MSDNHPYQIEIPPIPEGVARPLWSVMIPTYNCADYLRITLASVLEQDLGADVMQIEVIDDFSTHDDPEAIVKELGGNRVSFYRQPHNVGYIRNFETCLLRSRGSLIHILHGDDCVRHDFYQKIQQAFNTQPHIGAAFCRSIYVDELGHWLSLSPLEAHKSGVLENWLETIAKGQRLTTPSVVVRRAVYEAIGGFDRRFTCAGEDWEMWVRIATRYPVWFEAEPLALYRVKRLGSLTGDSIKTGALVRDMLRATEIIELYLSNSLPGNQAQELTRQARQVYAHWGIEAVQGMLIEGKNKAAIAHLQDVFRCSKTSKTMKSILKMLLEEIIRRINRIPHKVANLINSKKHEVSGY